MARPSDLLMSYQGAFHGLWSGGTSAVQTGGLKPALTDISAAMKSCSCKLGHDLYKPRKILKYLLEWLMCCCNVTATAAP